MYCIYLEYYNHLFKYEIILNRMLMDFPLGRDHQTSNIRVRMFDNVRYFLNIEMFDVRMFVNIQMFESSNVRMFPYIIY